MTLTARRTTYRGIPMRSRLEGRFARYLDWLGVDWTYEPLAYAGPTGDYLPDFEVRLEGQVPIFVELKPTIAEPDLVERALERIGVIWDSLPSAVLVLAFGDSDIMLTARGRTGRWTASRGHNWQTAADGPMGDGAGLPV